ncbi:complement factor H-related protein 5-like [Haemaphysalis longicornis]
MVNGDRKFFKDGYRYSEDMCCPAGTMVIYTCRDRYEIEGTEVIHCTDDGSWTHSAPKCKEYPCRRFEPGDHVHVDISEASNDETFPVGTRITFRCETGYHMRGVSSLLCMESGWFGQPPKCEQYKCRRFEPGPHLRVDVFGVTNITAFPEGTVITFMCEEQYTLQGISMSICQDGHWLGKVPTCKAFQTCPRPFLEFGYFVGSCCEPGDSVTFFCNEDNGYCMGPPSASPPRSATCLLTGVWSEPIPTCERCGCRRFETEPHLYVNEFQKPNSSIFHDGTIITFGCEAGYLLLGPRSSLCSEGVWLGRTQKCEHVKCEPLKTPLNGYINTTNSTAVGAKVRFGCFNGYMLVGSAERMCVEEGRWDGTPTMCLHRGLTVAKNRSSCTDPGTPDNGFRLLRGHFVPGSRVIFGCNPGYDRRGDSSIECLQNKTWASTPPHCLGPYYFDETEVVRKKIESRLHDVRQEHSCHFAYIVFNHFSSIGPQNFRHVISLAKAITTKLFMTSARSLVGIISVGGDSTIIVDPMKGWSLEGTLQRLDQIPYTYGTTTPIPRALIELRKSIRRVHKLLSVGRRSQSYSVFILADGTEDVRHHLTFYLGSKILQNGSLEMFSLGVRGLSQHSSLRRLTWRPSEARIFMLRDYDAMNSLSQAINNGVHNVFDGNEMVEFFGRFFTPELYQKGLVRDGLTVCPPKIRHFVYFVFDASWSIGANNFRKCINLAKAITEVIVTKHDGCVGAAIISGKIKRIIPPLVCYSTEDAIRLLDGMKYSNSSDPADGEGLRTFLQSEASAFHFEELNGNKLSFLIFSNGPVVFGRSVSGCM